VTAGSSTTAIAFVIIRVHAQTSGASTTKPQAKGDKSDESSNNPEHSCVKNTSLEVQVACIHLAGIPAIVA